MKSFASLLIGTMLVAQSSAQTTAAKAATTAAATAAFTAQNKLPASPTTQITAPACMLKNGF